MKKLLWAMLIATLSLAVSAGGTGLQADGDAAAQNEVKKIDIDLAKMLVKGDWDKYAASLAEDYVRIGEKGQIQDKDAVLAELRSGRTVLLDVIPEELAVRIYGDTAVLTGHLTVLTRQNGKVTTSFSRYTSVYVRRSGQWSPVTLQVTPLKE